MPITSLTPYLFFDGNAADAVALYERVLGARVDSLQRFGDHPAEEGCEGMQPDPTHVMHAQLFFGDAPVMLSDTPGSEAISGGGHVQLTLSYDDLDEMRRRFDALAPSGQVTMPIQPTFWAAGFGTLTDAFGVRWMFNCDAKA